MAPWMGSGRSVAARTVARDTKSVHEGAIVEAPHHVTNPLPSAYHSRVRTPLLLVLLIGLGPLRAAAQPVFGVVVEAGGGVPVSGAMVLLLDEDGGRVDQMLTDAAGRFRLDARRAGLHTITVERIGYASVTTDPFTPAADAGPMRIEAPVDPIELKGIVVSGEPRCEVRPEEGAAAARVWEEARKALAAEAWTRAAGLYRYTLLRYERRLDRSAREILADSTKVMTDRAAAFVSAPIEDLVSEGFVQSEGDSASVFYAPDAEALLSDAFLDSHCMAVVDGGARTVGLAFQPVAGRTVPEIAGVLWLDSETAELQRIQFGYVNLLDSPEVGYPPGEVRFKRLPDGAWVVGEWWIRMPSLMEGRRGNVLRTGHRVEGGTTASITDASGRTVVDAWTASIFGVVTDTAGTGPPPGSVVVARKRAGAATAAIAAATGVTTSDDGSFLFAGLEAGRHVLWVPRPALTRMGLAEPEVTVEGRLGQVAHVRMGIPTVADALVFSCGGEPRPPDTAPVMGRIRRADDTGAVAAQVQVRWPAATEYAPPTLSAPHGPDGETGIGWTMGRDGAFATASTTTDDRGLFLLCDVPHGARLRVAVSDPAGAGPAVRRTLFVPPDAPALEAEIVLPAGPDAMTALNHARNPAP